SVLLISHVLHDRAGSCAPPAWLDAFACRSTRTRDAVAAVHAAEDSASLDVPIAVLAESYVHMHLNRLFRAEQRAQELVVYDFLSRLYESRAARRRATAVRGIVPGQVWAQRVS